MAVLGAGVLMVAAILLLSAVMGPGEPCRPVGLPEAQEFVPIATDGPSV